MKFTFYLLATWTMVSGILAVTQRNVMHCAIALIAFFAGIAGVFFNLHAEFLGAIQIIVYVGAVAVLILFAIMLTHHLMGDDTHTPFSSGSVWGWVISFTVLAALIYSLGDQALLTPPSPSPNLTTADIGQAFMTRYAIPFEVISLLLTAALVGAVVIALEEHKIHEKKNEPT